MCRAAQLQTDQCTHLFQCAAAGDHQGTTDIELNDVGIRGMRFTLEHTLAAEPGAMCRQSDAAAVAAISIPTAARAALRLDSNSCIGQTWLYLWDARSEVSALHI